MALEVNKKMSASWWHPRRGVREGKARQGKARLWGFPGAVQGLFQKIIPQAVNDPSRCPLITQHYSIWCHVFTLFSLSVFPETMLGASLLGIASCTVILMATW